jgi:hypothetical protein
MLVVRLDLPLVDLLQLQHTYVELVLLGRILESLEELGPYLAAATNRRAKPT